MKGEHLWFKAYIQNQTQQLPATNTTNLHVGIFSENGDLLVKKKFLVNRGICYGDFEIDSTFLGDSYTLMAWTNYIKNFERATPFLQKISIVGATKKTEITPQPDVTIIMQPEGQHIVSNTFNNVGFTVLDNTLRPIKTDAIQLVTDKDVQVQSNIKTNRLGQGRFGFFADPKKSYFLKVKTADDIWVRKKIENRFYHKFGIAVDNTAEGVVLLKPKWLTKTAPLKTAERYTLAIFNANRVSFKKDDLSEGDNSVISISRNKLPYGINTVVILDQLMKPLAHRMFFNQQTSKKRVLPIEVNYCLTENQDSLQLDLILPEGNTTMANVSVSVLPAKSESSFPNNTISSSFLIQPYLKQQLANGNYFFEGIERSSHYQLDTRLLMEGTDKFHWDGKTFDDENISYDNEKYISVKGKILDADPKNEKQVSIMSQSFGSMNLFDIASNKQFKGSLPLFEGDSVLISVLNQQGKLRKPNVELYFEDNDKEDFNHSKWLKNTNPININPRPPKVEENLSLSDKTIVLEEVVVSEKVKEKKKFQITTEIEGRVIDKTDINRYKSFATYIRKLGFQIRPNILEGGIRIYVVHPSTPGGLYPAVVTIEGTNVNAGELMNLPLSSIKTIVFNKFVRPHIGPFISISLRYDYDELLGKKKFASVAVPHGYSRIQNYFSPNYPDFNPFLYQKYGAIWWENQREVDSKVPTSIRVPLSGQQAVKVIVEGMSDDGVLYQTEEICNPFKEEFSEK
ncbi:MAG: hypothetical protein AAF554_17200 [Bacteroidota bacterium]